MTPVERFRSHASGTDMTNSCSEADAVKMIIEMLLGSSNDIFGRLEKSLDKVCTPDDSQNHGSIRAQVFHITPFGLHTQIDKLSATLLQGILKWFAQFGSHMYICRQFALHSHNAAEPFNQRTELTSAVLDSLRSSVSNLLSAVEEALCDFEQKVLELPLRNGRTRQHGTLEQQSRITLIALYQRCLSWQTLFQSLAGLVCSALPVSAIAVLTQSSTLISATASTASATNSNTTDTAALSTVFEKLAVRGILQEVGEMLRLGGLVDFHPSMRLLSGGIKSSRNKSGFTTFDVPTTPSIPNINTNTATTTTHTTTVDVSLTLSLTSLRRSEYYLYAQLLYSAMLEKYLTNLVAMVWATNTSTNSGGGSSGSSSGGSAYTNTSNNSVNVYSALDTPNKALPQTPNTHKTHPNTPSSTNKNHLRNKTHRDIAAIDSVLRMFSTAPHSTHSDGAGSGGNSSRGVSSTLATRQKQRRVASLLHHARQLLLSSAQYEVPDFLLPITVEALVSARDVLILQKSHVQRQSPSYNLSSLKALVRDSVLEYRRTLLPHHYTLTTTTNTTTNTNTTNPNTNNTSTNTTASQPLLLPLTAADANDPVVSYLLTGRSVKIVGVRTGPPRNCRSAGRGIKGIGGANGTSSGTNKENTNNVHNNTTTPTTTTSTPTTVTSHTLASYNGGGVTSNRDYLSVILAQHNALLSSVASASAAIVSRNSSGGSGGGIGDDDTTTRSITGKAIFGGSMDVKQSLIDRVSRVALHRTTITSFPVRAPYSIPTSELVHYTTSATKLRTSLLHRLKAQLRTARADSAAFVVHTHALYAHLRYIRDVFFVGVPDFYAPIRELCLNLTEWKSSVRTAGATTHANTSSNVYRNSTTFIGEAIAGTMLEKAPTEGIRHLNVVVGGGSGGVGSGVRRDGSGSVSGISGGGAVLLQDKLRAFLTEMYTTDITHATHSTHTANTTTAATTNAADQDVAELISIIASMHIDLLHHWPLTQFVHPDAYTTLNHNMRFLLLLTASRWTAEYWWMDAVSNHSLNTTSFTAGVARTPSAPPSPTKLSSPLGHGAIYGSGAAASNVFSTNPMHTTAYSLPSTPTHKSNANATTDAATSAHYLADVLQAKRNCRAGLAVWLHTLTILNNVFMAHIHRTLWPAFETTLHSHDSSLLHMQQDFQGVLGEADASLMLLREHVLGIVIKGFAASTSMRAAVVLEHSEIAVVQAQNKQLAALHEKIHKLSPLHKNKSKSKDSGADADAPTKKVSRNPRVEMRNVPKSSSSDDSSATSKACYHTSAGVLVAYRSAENAFAELKQAVAELSHKVEKEVRRSSGRGSAGREVRAMEELLMYLTA